MINIFALCDAKGPDGEYMTDQIFVNKDQIVYIKCCKLQKTHPWHLQAKTIIQMANGDFFYSEEDLEHFIELTIDT